jgi:hypothetical protein
MMFCTSKILCKTNTSYEAQYTSRQCHWLAHEVLQSEGGAVLKTALGAKMTSSTSGHHNSQDEG